MPSNESKRRWNAAHYTQIKVCVKPETAAAFKDACAAAQVSMAAALSNFMAEYSQTVTPDKSFKDAYATRKRRRAAVSDILAQLEQLALAEERYRDNIPENLQGSVRHEAASQTVDILMEAVDILKDAY